MIVSTGYVVRSMPLGQPRRYRTTGYGRICGHPVAITTSPAETR